MLKMIYEILKKCMVSAGKLKLNKIKDLKFCSFRFRMVSICAWLLCIYFEVAKQHPTPATVASLLKLCLQKFSWFSHRQSVGMRSNTSPTCQNPGKVKFHCWSTHRKHTLCHILKQIHREKVKADIVGRIQQKLKWRKMAPEILYEIYTQLLMLTLVLLIWNNNLNVTPN